MFLRYSWMALLSICGGVLVISMTACGNSTSNQAILDPTPSPTLEAETVVSITAQNVNQLSEAKQFDVESATDFTWCSNGDSLCVATKDGLAVYDAGNFMVIARATGIATRLITSSPDQQTLAWVENDNIVEIWNQVTESRREIITNQESIIGLAFSPDGETLAGSTGDMQVVLWAVDSGTPKLSWEYPGWLVNLNYSPDGGQLVGASQNEFAIPFFDITNGVEQRRLEWTEHASPILYGAQFSPDWTKIAWVTRGTIQLMNVASGSLGDLLGHEDFINSTSWSPDSKLIATTAAGTVDGNYYPLITIWNVESGKIIATLTNDDPLLKAAFSPDGSSIAALDSSGIIHLWTLPGN